MRSQGGTAREAQRCSKVAQANALYLQHHPAHILVVVQAQRAVFTRGDIEAGFRDRLQLTKTELAGLVSEAMASGAAVRLVQNSPDGQAQYVTTARASEMQRQVIAKEAIRRVPISMPLRKKPWIAAGPAQGCAAAYPAGLSGL